MAYNYITFALYVRCGFSVSVSSQCKGIQIPNTGAAISIIFVTTCVYQDKTRLLSRQKYFVSTKLLLRQIFVATNTILSEQTSALSRQSMSFVTTKVCLSRQTRVLAKIFVATKIFCRDKYNYGTTKVLSLQAYFCRDKRRVLSRQTHVCLLRKTVCHDKNYTCGSSRQ